MNRSPAATGSGWVPELGPLPLLQDETLIGPARDWKRRVFVNRDLRMDHIEWVGFDMDYTLAIYRGHEIEALTFDLTRRRLVERCGYPASLLDLRYEPAQVIRGLVVDKENGNLMKVNRFGHCMRAYHGSRALSAEERYALYATRKLELAAPRFHWLDTIFCLPEGALYLGLVELLEKEGATVDYARVYDDVRAEMDAVHADAAFKNDVAAHLERFVDRDPLLPITLHRFRSAGKRLFLLTNSRWAYTDKVMRYLLEGSFEPYGSWLDYFDIAVVYARKPDFFRGDRPLTRPEVAPERLEEQPEIAQKVWEGGNIKEFERLVGLPGNQVLYVGDHIYGDMLRSKKDSLWRTAMVIPELEHEIETCLAHTKELAELDELAERRRHLDHAVNYHRAVVKSLERLERDRPDDPVVKEAMARALSQLRRHRSELKEVMLAEADLDDRLDREFNRRWGSIFRDGYEKSRFWEQVEDYACLYTSRVSNFCFYSPVRHFRPPRGMMPHEPVPARRSWFS